MNFDIRNLMMSERLQDEMIEHMNAEFESYYIYLSMAGYFDNDSWNGFANWMYLQAEEERNHAMKFYNHLLQRGIQPKLLSISEPKMDFGSPLEVFQEALKHEKKITQLIENVLDTAIDEKDRGAENLLRWFCDEQIEEEDTVGEIVDRIERVQDDPKGLMLLDSELGQRQAAEL